MLQAVNLSVENISGFKFWAVLTLMERGYITASFFIYAAFNAVLVLCAVGITVSSAVGSTAKCAMGGGQYSDMCSGRWAVQ